MDLFVVDIIGVFAFAVCGAKKGIQTGAGYPMIFVCAFLTALGGGTIRELMLGHVPFYFSQYDYIIVVITSTIFAIFIRRHFAHIEKYLYVLDAIGLGTFAYIGAHAAWSVQAGPIVMIFFAILTAAGGGVLADIVTSQKPVVLYEDFYIPPAALLAIAFAYLGPAAQLPAVICGLITSATILRLGGLYVQHHRRKQIAATTPLAE